MKSWAFLQRKSFPNGTGYFPTADENQPFLFLLCSIFIQLFIWFLSVLCISAYYFSPQSTLFVKYSIKSCFV
jgi:hypothetical protein